MSAKLDIVGLSEVAEIVGTSKAHIAMMRTRGQLPAPDATLACGPIWQRSTIDKWQHARQAVPA